MTRLLADENFHNGAIRLLREAGHDVVAAKEVAPGAPDETVLAWARRARRILLTEDSDHGELVFGRGLPPPPGIVYLRTRLLPPEEIVARVLEALADREQPVEGALVIIDSTRKRRRPFPRRGDGERR